MRKTSRCGTAASIVAATALLIGAASQAKAVVTISLSDVQGNQGDTVTVSAGLMVGTAAAAGVAGTQNNINFPPQAQIAAKANGKPNCTVNPDIDKTGTAFTYLPNGCTAGTDCTGVKALVLALDNVSAIPDGSVLYTCQLAISADAVNGEYTLEVTDTGASDPDGGALAAVGANGTVTIGTPPVAPATITIGSGRGEAGTTTSIDIGLSVGTGALVAGTQNDINFPAQVQIAAKANGKPNCTVNPDIDKTGTAFTYLPNGCTPGTDCTGVKALVLALDNVAPIPDGSVLYTCQVAIAADAADGDYTLSCSNAGASDPDGGALMADCTSGTVSVGVPPTNTPVPATNTPVAPTNTPVPPTTPTNTPEAATPTPTPTAIQSNEAVIVVGSVEASPGDTIPVDVTLFVGSELQVAGTQNDVEFGPGISIAQLQNGRPDCTVNPAIGKSGTAFNFVTEADGSTAMRAFVLALDNVDAIPTGSVLYTCNVVVDQNTNNDFPLTCVKPGGSAPDGTATANVSCNSGSVDVPQTVSGELAAGGVLTTIPEGGRLHEHRRRRNHPDLAQRRLRFDRRARRARLRPDGLLLRRPAGDGEGARGVGRHSARPRLLHRCLAGLPEGATVDMFKDGVLVEDCADTSGVANPDPCVFERSVGGNGNTNITILTSTASLWNFGVSTEVPPTATPTLTATPIPATNTPVVEATDTPVVQPTPTRNPFDEDDGCQIVAPADSSLAWLLFMPLGMLLWLRRRSR